MVKAKLEVMNYFRRTLPSLDALVYFEAAARHLNFTHAAKELHVTQVAVSKRVRTLEEDLGICLFERRGRGLVLTEAGKIFAGRVHAGLSFLEEGISVARGRANDRREIIQVAANENVNFFWLDPRVRDFQMRGNNAVVAVLSANNVADVIRSDTDLAIFYGQAAPEGWRAKPLFDEIIAPVAAPSYWQQLDAGLIPNATLLDYHREAPDWVNWRSQRQQLKESWGSSATIMQCSSYIQSVGLARAGNGIALGVLPLLEREISEGALRVRGGTGSATGHKYFLATPEGQAVQSATSELIAFLSERP